MCLYMLWDRIKVYMYLLIFFAVLYCGIHLYKSAFPPDVQALSPGACSETSGYAKDYEAWWHEIESDLHEYGSCENLVFLYNLLKDHPGYDEYQKAIINEASFEYFPCINDIYDRDGMDPEIEKHVPPSLDMLRWISDCAYTNDKALYHFLRIGTCDVYEGIREEYTNIFENFLNKRDVSLFTQLTQLEKQEDITGIINMAAFLFIRDENLIGHLNERLPSENICFDRMMDLYNNLLMTEPGMQFQENSAFEEKYLSSDFYTIQNIFPLHYDIQNSICIGYKTIPGEVNESRGTFTLVGIPEGQTEIYLCEMNTNESIPLGKMGIIVNTSLSYDGKLLSVNDSKNVAVIDLEKGTMKMLHESIQSSSIYHTNWSKDSSILYIHLDTQSCYYAYNVKEAKLIKQRGGFEAGEEVFRGYTKSSELYSKEERFGIATSLYKTFPEKHIMLDANKPNVIHDIYGDYLLMTVEYRGEGSGSDYVFKRCNVLTKEDNHIEYFNTYKAPYNIYKACFLEKTGEIIYTRVVPGNIGFKYELVRLTPSLETSDVIRVSFPMFTLSPGETKLYFSNGTGYCNPGFIVDTVSFSVRQLPAESSVKGYSKSFAEFLTTMQRAYAFYTGINHDYPEEIFTNTYDPIPQEALDNITRENTSKKAPYANERFSNHMPLEYSAYDNGKRIHASLNLYFYSPHELVKEGSGIWKITGFSTYPGSAERENILDCVMKGLDFKNGNIKGEVEEGCIEAFRCFRGKQVEIGEIELWTTSEPHRAPNLDWVNLARVKIKVFTDDYDYEMHIINLSRPGNTGEWSIGSVRVCR